jgi:aspartyl/glutamyl-tRNA(Asn/Gln) amidotransferase C subunit
MPISQSDIEKVAQLAHLDLGEEELKTFGPQMAEIVAYVEQLNELDTTNIEPPAALHPKAQKLIPHAQTKSAAPWAKKPPSPRPLIPPPATSASRKCCSR